MHTTNPIFGAKQLICQAAVLNTTLLVNPIGECSTLAKGGLPFICATFRRAVLARMAGMQDQ